MTAEIRLSRRQFLRLAGATASAALLTACAPGLGSPPAGGNAPAGKSAESAPPAATAGVGKESVTLRLASWQWDDPAYKPFWDGTTQAFSEKYSNVKFDSRSTLTRSTSFSRSSMPTWRPGVRRTYSS